MNHTVVVLVGRVHRGVLEALAYATLAAPQPPRRGLAWSPTRRSRSASSRQWEDFGIDVPLEIVYSPYRELTRPVLRYIDELDARWENDIVTVSSPSSS